MPCLRAMERRYQTFRIRPRHTVVEESQFPSDEPQRLKPLLNG
jgi:hypothetical protein